MRASTSVRSRFGNRRHRRLFLERLEDRSLLAAVITVNSTEDSNTRDEVLTLREAILVNNRTLVVGTLTAAEQDQVVGTPTSTDADTINVPAGTYTLTIAGQNENAAATGDLDITDDLTIVGAGQATTIIEAGTIGGPTGNGIDRVFQVLDSAGSILTDVNMSDVTIRHGRGPDGAGIEHSGAGTLTITNSAISNNSGNNGGGIENDVSGTINLTNSTVSGNSGSNGGGIENNNGTLNVTGSTITGNTAQFDGGGIENEGNGMVTVTSSVISGNSTTGSDGAGIENNSNGTVIVIGSTIANNTAANEGGGLNNDSGGAITITNSTISGNSAGNFNGGGIQNDSSNGTLTVTNSTISGNRADNDGGGIVNEGGVVNLTNVTITNNLADNDSSGSGNGGGVSNNSGTMNVKNSIIAGNTDTGGQAPDASGTLNSQGNNLIQNTAGATIGGTGTGNISGQSPLLGPLADNGGPTQTHLPQSGSPAIDAGNNVGAPETDQRGVDRPQPPGGDVDIGAVEVEQEETCSLVVSTTSDVVSDTDSVNSLREAIICANETPGDDTINVPAGTYTLTITGQDEDAAATGDLDITEGLTISGAGASTTIIQAGTNTTSGIDRVFHIVGGAPTVSMSNITVRHGLLPVPEVGGGIRNEGELTLTNTVVTRNQADRGGGIYHTAEDTLTIDLSTISENTADKGGGILNNLGDVVIIESTVSGNIGTTQGGGILNTGDSTSLEFSTVSGNDAGESGGGGIFNRAPLTLTNSTISGNTSDGSGGGISNTGGGTLDLESVTIANNTADDDGDETGDGGGVFNPSNTFDVHNTIIADNTDRGGEAPDVSGTMNSLGFNLIEDTSGVTITGDTTGNITGQDPLLGPLTNNGGPTQTHALLSGSPAIDAAEPEDFPPTDQRDVERPQGEGPDIGAFEAGATTPGLAVCEVTTLNTSRNRGTAALAPDADNPGDTALIVTGTSSNDVIIIEPRPSNRSQLRVKRNGQVIGIFQSSDVDAIVVFGLGGNDTIIVNATLSQSATLLGDEGNDFLFGARASDGLDGGEGGDHLFGRDGNDTACGGDGNDFLYGQSGNDLVGGDAGKDRVFGEAGDDFLLGGDGTDFLYGGTGNDRLFGQAGSDNLYGSSGNDILVGGDDNDRLFGGSDRDLVIGGDGADTLFGDAHGDILVAGFTIHDENEDALLAILAEWTSGRSYTTRVNNIRSGGGANGAFVLNDATVSDDDVTDTLWGNGGQDWFHFGVRDRLRGRAGNELVN